jgi:hypothetical protein
MADILVQSAVRALGSVISDASQKFNYAAVLGKSLELYLVDLMVANAGPFITGAPTPGSFALCELSDMCRISHCTCNFSGSGTSSTDQCGTANPWKCNLLGTGLISSAQSISETVNFILARDPVLTNIHALDNAGVRRDIYLAYLAAKDNLTTQKQGQWYFDVYSTLGGASGQPGLPISFTNRIKVCGDFTTGVGGSCTWTVPAGATRAKFQVWGAGQGSNPGCCCGGSPGGSTGAYAEMTVCVTPGEQYVACAGCSCQRWCCSNTEPGYGCMSGVTGPAICCLKADGAWCAQNNCNSMNCVRGNIGAAGACTRYQNIYCTDSGPCWCGNGEYCFTSSCATCGVVAVYPNCSNQTCGCSCANLTRVVPGGDGVADTHRGIIGGGCLDTSNFGYHIRPPVINSDTGRLFTDGCYCGTFTSGSCCGGCLATYWTWHPGHGGAYTHVMSGSNDHKGDVGRGGMVQISWS